MKLTRRDKILDWAYDSNNHLWYLPQKCVILVTGIYWCTENFIRQTKEAKVKVDIWGNVVGDDTNTK